MLGYIMRRLLLAVPTFLGTTALVFLLTHLIPGGPVERQLMAYQTGASGQQTVRLRTDAHGVPPEAVEEMRRFYGLDRPVHERYLQWLWRLAHLDLGRSYVQQRPVLEVIGGPLRTTVSLGLIAFVVSYLTAIPLGVLRALQPGGHFDRAAGALVMAAYAVPGWALGTFLLVLFGGGSFWSLVPLGGFAFDARHLFLPVLCYGAGIFPIVAALTRQAMIDTLQQEYVRAAQARGVSWRRAVVRHGLRNSLIPIASSVGRALMLVVAGSFLIERVFNIDGAGYVGYTAALQRDYPVALGIVTVVSLATLGGSIVADTVAAAADPRIRFR